MAVKASASITLTRVDDGAAGKGVSKTEIFFYLSTSNTTQSGGSWVTTPPDWINGRYYWQKIKTTFTDGTTSESAPVCITGAKGSTGAAGKGVSSITTEFYLSTSKTSRTGGSWITTMPEWTSGKYLWTRSKIVYTNPSSTVYTTPICDSSWEAVNEIEIGGRNLVLNSDAEISVKNTFKTYELSEYGRRSVSGKTVAISLDACSDTAGVTIDVYLRKIDDGTGSSCNAKASIKNVGTEYQRRFIVVDVQTSDDIVQVAIRSNAVSGEGCSTTATVSVRNIKVEIGNMPTDWTLAPEDVTDDINEVATTVQEQRTDIISDCENIILTSLKSYVTTGDYEELRSTVQSQLQILSDEINMKFTKTSDDIGTVNKDLQSKLTELYKHISFSDEGIIVKSGENSIELQLDNEKGIIFSKNGNPFGTWDGTNFHTGNILIDVNERAQFGNFAFVPRSDGSLMFLKVGG